MKHIPELNNKQAVALQEIKELYESKDVRNISRRMKSVFLSEYNKQIAITIMIGIVPVILFIACIINESIHQKIPITQLEFGPLVIFPYLSLLLFVFCIIFYIVGQIKKNKQFNFFFNGEFQKAEIIQIKNLLGARGQTYNYSKVFININLKNNKIVKCSDIVRRDIVELLENIPETNGKKIIDVIYAPKISKKRVFIPLKLLSEIN